MATADEIQELEERLKQADIVSDPDFLNEILVDGFYFTGPSGAIYTKEQILEAHRPAGAQKFTRFETSDMRMQDYGDTVIVTLRTDFTVRQHHGDHHHDHDHALRYTRVWLKREGHWRVAGGSAVPLEDAE